MTRDFEPSKPIKPALARAQRPSPSLVQLDLSDPVLTASPWYQLAEFCNESYKNFIPRNEEYQQEQKNLAPTQKKCVEILSSTTFNHWDELIKRNFRSFEHQQKKIADRFFFRLSKRYSDSPLECQQKLKQNIQTFIELAEYALLKSDNRDLLKISEFSDNLKDLNNSPEKTFYFLNQLPQQLNPLFQSLLLNYSEGYQTLLELGASEFLKDFCFQLQKKFKITYTAIKDQAAQDLVRELEETKVNLCREIDYLKQENADLKAEIQAIEAQAFQDAVCQLTRTLQHRSQPILDQIVDLYQRLNKRAEQGETLSNDDLRILIILGSILEALRSLNITSFPEDLHQIFRLRGEDLNQYSYIEGSTFATPEDEKTVSCVRYGWQVGSEIITPAQVKESSQPQE